MGRFLFVLPVLLVAARAVALDITSCGQTIPVGKTGELQNDLVCSIDDPGVTVERSTVLYLNGHSITGGGAGVIGPDAGRFAVRGPGTIAGADVAGITFGDHGVLTVSDVTVEGSFWGIRGVFGADTRSRIKATNVIVTGNSYIGIEATRIDLRNVDASGNPGFAGLQGARVSGRDVRANGNGTLPASSGRGMGIVGFAKIQLKYVEATDNVQAGVLGNGRFAISFGTITGNNGEYGSGVDIQSLLFPRLRDVTCGLSDRWGTSGVQPFGVCAND